MVYKGSLNKRDGEIQVYLFDHALLFTKLVKTKQHEQYRVYRRVGSFYYSYSLLNSHHFFLDKLSADTTGASLDYLTS